MIHGKQACTRTNSSLLGSSEGVSEVSGSPVEDWEAIIHKNVRSKDGGDVGNVDGLDGDSIVIITEGARGVYKMPKVEVESFDGAEVRLKSTIAELKKYTSTQGVYIEKDREYK